MTLRKPFLFLFALLLIPLAAPAQNPKQELNDQLWEAAREGDVLVVKAGPKHELLATNAVGEVMLEPATFMASPVAYEGKILLTSEEGETFILKAGPKHEVLRSNSLGEHVYAPPAIANRNIFIRGERHLFAIGK